MHQPRKARMNTAPKMVTREIVLKLRWKICGTVLPQPVPARFSLSVKTAALVAPVPAAANAPVRAVVPWALLGCGPAQAARPPAGAAAPAYLAASGAGPGQASVVLKRCLSGPTTS